MITSSGSNYLKPLPSYLTFPLNSKKENSCHAVPCLPSLASSSACSSSAESNSTCFSHVGIFCALISVQLILDLVVSIAENFVIKTIYFSIFVVASVYPRINVKFPNHALCMFTHQIISRKKTSGHNNERKRSIHHH